MRQILFIPFAIVLLATSCKKGKADQPANPGGGGGGGGQTGTAHISSWSPAVPYADDTVTFHGTGFDPTASGNVVTTCNHVFQVISASSTQVKAHLVNDITSCIYYNDMSEIVFQANGWSDTLPDFHWKKTPRIMELNYFAPYYCNAFFRGGDSLEVVGIGFGSNSLASWSIGDHQSSGPVVVDTGVEGFGYIRTRLGPSDLGSAIDECDTATVLVTLTNTDGRVFSKQTRIGHGPHMSFQSIVPNINSASRADMLANNLVIYATVYGRYLKSCMAVRLYRTTGGPVDELILTAGGPPGGFPNSYVVGPIAPISLAVGNYVLKPVNCDGSIDGSHIGSFVLTP